MPRTDVRYGWVPDHPDQRDFLLREHEVMLAEANLPAVVDLRPLCPPVYDQGQLGSCTGNGVAGVVQFERMKQKLSNFVPSRLFIYYEERVLEGTVGEDAGAQIRDGMKVVAGKGAPPEADWPYNISKFTQKPPAKAYTDAVKDRALKYLRAPQDHAGLRSCLAQGYPIVFGFTVYESFESEQVAETGVMPMPKRYESVLGGHCVVAVGYDDHKGVYIVRNSWGDGWGDKGYFYMPQKFMESGDYASDFWTVRLVG